MTRRVVLIFMMLVAVVSATDGQAAEEQLRIAGGSAAVENVLNPTKAPFEKASGMKLVPLALGPKHALVELDRGAIDAACIAMTQEELKSLLVKEGMDAKMIDSLQYKTVAKDRIVVILHKENPVSKLTRDQLKGIFTGKIQNWKDVGGKDLPVIVVWGKLIQGTYAQFTAAMLDGEKPLRDVLEANTAADVKNSVVTNPEAIGLGPVGVIDGSVQAPEVPEISREVRIYTKGAPSAALQKYIEFVTGQGKNSIKQ